MVIVRVKPEPGAQAAAGKRAGWCLSWEVGKSHAGKTLKHQMALEPSDLTDLPCTQSFVILNFGPGPLLRRGEVWGFQAWGGTQLSSTPPRQRDCD